MCQSAFPQRLVSRLRPGARRIASLVSHQDLEIADTQLWPQSRSRGYFGGWGLVEGEAGVGLNEVALPHPQDGSRFGRISAHVLSACERRDRTRALLGVLGR
jgi:hypothetical protein